MSVQTEIDRISGLVTESHEKVKAKGGTTAKPYVLANLPGAIDSILGGVELPTLENPVTEAEVFLGKEYIDGNGQMATGSFTIDNELTEQDDLILQISNALRNKAAANAPGTLPPLENPAASSDMATGKELYDQDGNVVTGTLPDLTDGAAIFANSTHEVGGTKGGNTFNVAAVYSNTAVQGVIVRPSARLGIRSVPTSLLGDATAAQVAKGATFTSAAGYLMEGTMEAASGDGLAATKGNTSSPTIETGLSTIDYFVLMATGFSRAGLMQLLYRKPNNAISYILCTSYSYRTMTTELNHASMASSTLFTIDGGTVTWNGTGTSAFMSGESYMWLAFGTA